MKKQILMIAALLIVLSSAVFANEGEVNNSNTSVEVNRTNDNSYSVVYKGVNTEKVNIKIVDENNQLIFAESIKNRDSFVRPYNLSNLPQGTYTIIVTDANGTRSHEVKNYSASENANSNGTVRFKSFEPNRYVLNIVNTTSQTAIIKIYNNDNKLVYTTTENLDGGNYAKIYNLKNVNSGLIEVYFNDNVKTFRF